MAPAYARVVGDIDVADVAVGDAVTISDEAGLDRYAVVADFDVTDIEGDVVLDAVEVADIDGEVAVDDGEVARIAFRFADSDRS